MLLLGIVAVWGMLRNAEVVHGALRTRLLTPCVREFGARQIGVFTASVLMLGMAYLSVR